MESKEHHKPMGTQPKPRYLPAVAPDGWIYFYLPCPKCGRYKIEVHSQGYNHGYAVQYCRCNLSSNGYQHTIKQQALNEEAMQWL